MRDEKILMAEAAVLYYEKKMTQQQIARELELSRQTVSKLLSDAVREGIVEIRIHDPVRDREAMGAAVCAQYGIERCVVCGVSGRGETLRRLMTVRAAAAYLTPMLQAGGRKIALSWGRTVQALIEEMPDVKTEGNVVFPLFGATEQETAFFSSNELARAMADKLGAGVKYAWFPYLLESSRECEMLKELSCYQTMQKLWEQADLAIVGIGNTEVYRIFTQTFGHSRHAGTIVGDVATHFFDGAGTLVKPYANTLCATAENIRNAKQTVAVACGDEKAEAIAGALKTGLIDVLITDEYTAARLLAHKGENYETE